MPRQLRWSELRGGIISAAVVVLIVLATLVFARVGALHGRKVTLYVVAEDATGVISGTEVWLAGKHSGSVKDVAFRTPTNDSSGRIIITTDFLARDLPLVRRDSWAQVQAGGKLLGTPVVYVSAGSARLPGLRDGDTIRSRPKPRALDIAVQAKEAMPAFRELMTEVSALNTQLSKPTGTVGAYRARGMPALGQAMERMSRIGGKMTGDNGTIGLAMRGGLAARASRVMAAADSLMAFASSGDGTVGRFRRDSTLMTTARGIFAELDSLRAQSKGFGGSDSSLAVALAKRRALTDSLMADMKKNPMRYLHF